MPRSRSRCSWNVSLNHPRSSMRLFGTMRYGSFIDLCTCSGQQDQFQSLYSAFEGGWWLAPNGQVTLSGGPAGAGRLMRLAASHVIYALSKRIESPRFDVFGLSRAYAEKQSLCRRAVSSDPLF